MEDLISKKELLELTGISYGQLYRWKRKNLIPEEWFIRKSTFTGQETFFERVKILGRIDKIKNMKDDLSLDNIAEMFSPQLSDIFMNREELLKKCIISQMTLDIYEGFHGSIEVFSFEKILKVFVLEKMLSTGSLSLDEGKLILQNLEDNYKNFKDRDMEIVFIRKFGVGISYLTSSPNEIYFDSSCRIVESIKISEIMEELKGKLLD